MQFIGLKTRFAVQLPTHVQITPTFKLVFYTVEEFNLHLYKCEMV